MYSIVITKFPDVELVLRADTREMALRSAFHLTGRTSGVRNALVFHGYYPEEGELVGTFSYGCILRDISTAPYGPYHVFEEPNGFRSEVKDETHAERLLARREAGPGLVSRSRG